MTMTWHRRLLAIAAIIGAATGPSAANSATTSPPMAWFELALIAAAPLVGLPFILGMQVSVGSFKGLRQGWIFFLYCGVYFTAMGLVALVISVWRVGLVPHSFEFLVVGVALLSGVGLVRVIFNRQFERRS